ncbi:MAG: hypothetical protein AAFS10_23585 [Myxococcota bacterium]
MQETGWERLEVKTVKLKSMVFMAVALMMLGVAPWVVSAVDLEPRSKFDPECSAAEKELRHWREERARARVAAEQAIEAFDACQVQVARGKRTTCRREKRNLGRAVSRRTLTTEEFKRAATYHRTACAGRKSP